MKHSIKRQMAGIFITVLAVTFLCVGLINAFFLKDYYMSEKKKAIVSAYEVLNLNACSTVSFTLASPRKPSVPKYFPIFYSFYCQ